MPEQDSQQPGHEEQLAFFPSENYRQPLPERPILLPQWAGPSSAGYQLGMPLRTKLSFRQRVAAFLRWFRSPESIAVCGIAAAVLAVHLFTLTDPNGWNTSANPPTRRTIGDEVYYVSEASRILNGQSMERPEHPPLGKWIIATGMFIFGDNAVGWRSFPVLFAIVSIFIFYFICKRLVRQDAGTSGTGELSPPSGKGRFSRWFELGTFVPVFATFLFATENMSFVMGHAAMLDVFYVTFMLLGFLLFLRGNFVVSGVVLGLSMLCKAMAFLGILALPIYWAITRRDEILAELKYTWNALRGRKGVPSPRSEILSMAKLLAIVPLVWLAGLALLEFAWLHHWSNPIGRTIQMLTTLSSLNDKNYGSPTGVASMPWKWLVVPMGWYLSYTPRYLASIGWTVWVLIMPSMAYSLYDVIRGRVRGHAVALFALSWFAGTYGLLVLLKVLTERLMYTFYFYPSVAAVCLAIAWGAWRLWGTARRGPRTRVVFLAALAFYMVGTVATFVIMGPLLTNVVKLPT